ncbi:helix-turn-helix transcriptional regulator [Aeromonas salmonicida]|uniref:helix-turn-helix domain-containing protein n=1 Tax=Aeromonas salmonicida TaxID=645 RepID=UPI0030CEA59F
MESLNQNITIWLGKRIRFFRLKNNLSQEELADRCDLHRTYIGSCERGERNITVKNLHKICGALNVNLSEFFSGIE